ncbi:MAG: transposase [Candidatus Nitrosocosmicus sp.]
MRRDKWNVRKEGYLKIHISVNVKSKKILSIMKVTDEHIHDSKALPELVDNIINSDSNTTEAIGKIFADGAYEGNIFLDF